MLYQIVPALAALSTLLVTSGAQSPPWFCQSYDCPAFTSVDKGGYEVRNYEATVWATTSLTTANQELSRNERSAMFRELFNYISGRNANNQKIDMTVPVLTKIETLANGYKTTMMFYLSVANAPAPTSDNVVLVTRPAGPVFVKSFPGWWWPSSRTYRQKAAEMKTEIGTTSQFVDNAYYKAGYNAPYDFFSRKQFEVWVDTL